MLRIVRVAGHSFVGNWIPRDGVVFDFGMNRGAFCTRMAALFGCRIHGAEAHPALCAALPNDARIRARNVAIAGGPGVLKLSLYAAHCASGVLSNLERDAPTVDVPTVDLASFRIDAGVSEVALLKCDIEGSELAMLSAASDDELQRLGQITIEFHDFLDASQRPEVLRQIERLERLGFWAIDMSKNRMDVLLVNTRRHPMRGFDKAQLLWIKYWRAVGRIVRRRFGWVDSGEDGYSPAALQWRSG